MIRAECVLGVPTQFFTIDLQWAGHEIDMTGGHRYKEVNDIRIADTYADTCFKEFVSLVIGMPLTWCQPLKNAT